MTTGTTTDRAGAGRSEFLEAVRTAGAALRELFEPTPLQRNAFLSARYGAEIWLKREDLSPVRSYKLRGAFTAVRNALAARPDQRHFVCASAGNHAQGMAFACAHFGAEGLVFMPVTTPQQKIDKTAQFGGAQVEIRLVGDYFDDTLRAAKAHAEATGALFMPPYDDADVILGQATCAVEILEQLPAGCLPDVVVLPVGGGGLASGVIPVLEAAAPDIDVFFAEPQGAASLQAGLKAGHPVTLPVVDSFVDGAAVARIGDLNFAELGRFAPEQVLSAPEGRICTTILEMLNIEGMVLEPAGALSIDVLRDVPDIAGKTVVAVVSGGNFDFERLPEVKERALRWEGRKKFYILRLPQRPGALREFLEMLGPGDDIARFEYLKKNARNFGSVLIGIESVAAGNFESLEARMSASGLAYQDITEDAIIMNLII